MKKILFGVAALGLLGLAGAGLGLKAQDAVEAKADASDPLTTIYIDASVFGGANYDYYGYIWSESNDSNKAIVKGTLVPGTDSLYQVTNSIGADSIIAAAVTKDAVFTTDNWANVVSQTWDKKPSWKNGIPAQNAEYGINTLVVGNVADGKRDAVWETRNPSIADGAYLRGTYHGVENWGSNIALSNDKVTESITFDSAENKVYAFLELYAGDTFKFDRYFNGKELGMATTYSIEESDSVYYPATWSGNNVSVTNAGVYYITMGYGENEHASDVWYYVDNTATIWSRSFLGSMTCNNGGKDPLTWKNRVDETPWEWDDFATPEGANPYSALDEYAKNVLFNAVGSDDGTLIQQAAKRHDACVDHYKWSAFIKNASGTATRSAAKLAPEYSLPSVDGMSSVAWIVTFAVAALAIGAFFIARKRRAE